MAYDASSLEPSLDGLLTGADGDPHGIFSGSAGDVAFPDSFSGDFYRVQDDVTRGVTMDMPMDMPDDMSLAMYKNAGDFYTEPDVVKGGVLGGAYDSHLSYMDKPEIFGGAGMAPPCFGMEMSQAHEATFNAGTERFEEGDSPLPAPKDTFFKFEATTLFATCSSPADLGNAVLDFLCSKVISNILKVRRHKFAIKADAFIESKKCTLKVRIYSESESNFAIEFQRRSGDALTFQSIFCQAKEHIQSRFVVIGSHSEAARDQQHTLEPSLPQLPPSTSGAGELQPLLDMAGNLDVPTLQAEAAAALAKTAQDRSFARQLCSPEAFAEVLKLLQAESVDVLYPAALLLESLAELPEAGKLFAGVGILPKMLLMVSSDGACGLVRLQLAKAFCAAVGLCSSSLDARASEELSNSLKDAVQKTVDQPILRNLQDARYKLKGQGQVW